ncbi:glycine oxidase ThiO [Bacillus sp. FJAT-44742]|uniref:glycine oxidase ThiO n=1 Tax=Bacillus sp. FJAT-44742 TaxID=2014005 RepID=UPI002FCCF553
MQQQAVVMKPSYQNRQRLMKAEKAGVQGMKESIIILGGGVIGLAAAFECRRRGHDVTLLEKVSCGGQASGAAAGMLAPFSEIEEDPDDFFRLGLRSLRLYSQWIEDVKKNSETNFEFSNSGSLHVVYHEADLLSLESRQRWQGEFGVEAEIIKGRELFDLEPKLSKDIIAAMRYPEESHVYAPGYVKALEEACRNLGVTIKDHLEEVTVKEWESAVLLQAKNGETFTADKLVISSGAWAKEMEYVFQMNIPIVPIRGQICAYEINNGEVQHIVYSPQGYLVPKENGSLINGASEDIAGFTTEVTKKGIDRLVKWNKNVFPFLEGKEPFHSWAGLRPATQDGYPLIGRKKEASHIIFAAGHYRNGILLSPVTAEIVADTIDGKEAEIPLHLFDPNRF